MTSSSKVSSPRPLSSVLCLLLLLLPRPLVNRLPHPVLSSNELCEFAREPRDLRCSVLLCCFAFSCCCFGLTSFGFLCCCRPSCSCSCSPTVSSSSLASFRFRLQAQSKFACTGRRRQAGKPQGVRHFVYIKSAKWRQVLSVLMLCREWGGGGRIRRGEAG